MSYARVIMAVGASAVTVSANLINETVSAASPALESQQQNAMGLLASASLVVPAMAIASGCLFARAAIKNYLNRKKQEANRAEIDAAVKGCEGVMVENGFIVLSPK